MTPAARLTRAVIGLVLVALATVFWASEGFQVFAVALPAAIGLLYLADSLFGRQLFAQGYAWSVLVAWLFFLALALGSALAVVGTAAGWFTPKYAASHVYILGVASASANGYLVVTKFSFVRDALRISETGRKGVDGAVE
jgi:hypothetical protein